MPVASIARATHLDPETWTLKLGNWRPGAPTQPNLGVFWTRLNFLARPGLCGWIFGLAHIETLFLPSR